MSGTIHLALEGTFLSYNTLMLDAEDGYETSDTSTVTFGYPAAAGLRLGFLPIDALEFGAAASLRFDSTDSDGDEFSEGQHAVNVYLRYVAAGRAARFFAGPSLGGVFYRADDPGDFGEDDFETSGRMSSLGLQAGIYGFVARSFSLDPLLSFSYVIGSARAGDDYASSSADVSGFQVSLSLALSGWIATS